MKRGNFSQGAATQTDEVVTEPKNNNSIARQFSETITKTISSSKIDDHHPE